MALVILAIIEPGSSSEPNWAVVRKPAKHSYNLEDTLAITTDSVMGSNEKIAIKFEPTKSGSFNRQVYLQFTASRMRYTINACTGYNSVILATVPSDQNKVWEITRSKKKIIITCNGVKLIDLEYKNGLPDCQETWNKNDKEVQFLSSDSASDKFRILHAESKDGGETKPFVVG